MKHLLRYVLGGIVSLLLLSACNDDKEGNTPIVDMQSMNFRSESGAGSITLRWDVPENPGYFYLELRYYDPRMKEDRLKTVSSFTDEITIEDTRARYGEYTFTFTPFSEDGTPGSPFTLTATSGPAPVSVQVNRTPLRLTVDNFYTNAQEPSEGPLANICDGNTSNYFHTAWSVAAPDKHYLDINFGEPLSRFEIVTTNRSGNAAGAPTDVQWFRLASLHDMNVDIDTATPLYSYVHPDRSSGAQCTVMFPNEDEEELDEPIQFLRYYTHGNETNWNMAELSVNKVEIISFDPEVDEIPEYDK